MVVVVVELMNSGGMMEGMGKILLGKFPTHSWICIQISGLISSSMGWMMQKSLPSESRSFELPCFSRLVKEGILAELALQAWHNTANVHRRKQHCMQSNKKWSSLPLNTPNLLESQRNCDESLRLPPHSCPSKSASSPRAEQQWRAVWPPQSHPSTPSLQLSHTSGYANWGQRITREAGQCQEWGLQGVGNYHRVVLCHQAELVHANEANQLLGINISVAHIQIPPVTVYLKTGKDTYSHSCPLLSAAPPEALIVVTHRDIHSLGHHHPLSPTTQSPPLPITTSGDVEPTGTSLHFEIRISQSSPASHGQGKLMV